MASLFWSRWSPSWLLFIISSYVALLLLNIFLRFIHYVWWAPIRYKRILEKQGIRGPPPRFLIGNLGQIKALNDSVRYEEVSFKHDLLHCILPEYTVWTKAYGKMHWLFWGPEASIVVTDMEILRVIFSQKCALTWGKPYLTVQKYLDPLTGKGLITANGEVWSNQKRIVGPAFHFNLLKGFVEKMVSCTGEILEEIDQIVKSAGGIAEVEMGTYFTRLGADIIAHTQFGSSYEKGKEIFSHLDTLRNHVFRNAPFYVLPGSKLFPTKAIQQMRKLEKKVEVSIREIIRERKDSVNIGSNAFYGNDLLGLMLAESERTSLNDEEQQRLTTEQLVDNCKTFFFAGHETTARLLTWCFLLLAANPSCQERAREEAFKVLDGTSPNTDSIGKMKFMEMIIYETLRLYPAAPGIVRSALSETKIGDLLIPKGMSVYIPVLAIHLDRELWGEDAYEFKPERFVVGLGKACKHPMGFLPFAQGPRSCIGQNFAITEARVVLAMFLTRFKICVSPNYRHAPQRQVALAPLHGAPLILEAL